MAYSSKERSSAVARYLSEIREFPILSEEEERELAASLNSEDKAQALNGLIQANLAFVVKIVAEYRSPALPFEDLLNEGNLGLIEAAHRFDHTRGNRFLSYAVWWIRRSILRALSESTGLVRVPVYQKKKVRKIRAAERALARKLGRMPDREEISRELQSTIAKIDKILQTKRTELSLDDPIGSETETPISDFMVDPESVNPEEELLREERQGLIAAALRKLSDQERTVIINRFGLQGGKTLTLLEVEQQLGVTAERVRQIEFQAMQRMRMAIARNRVRTSPPKQLGRGCRGPANQASAHCH